MRHRRYEFLISKRLDGVLGHEESGRLEEHLRACDRCRLPCERMTRDSDEVSRACGDLRRPDLEELFDRTRRRLDSPPEEDGRRVAGRSWRAAGLALAAAGLLVAAVGWLALREPRPEPPAPGPPRYAAPRASGEYAITGGGPLRRGSVVSTDEDAAALELGDYCRIEMEPESTVRIGGEEHAEEISLEMGEVLCKVDSGKGSFAVQTEVGRVHVTGTSFIVQVFREEDDKMRMFVKVLAGAVLFSAAWGERPLAAGEEATTARRQPTAARATGAAMVEHAGKLYVVSGSKLARVDLKTLKVDLEKDLSAAGKSADADEEDKKRRKEFLARFDKNGDGEVAGDEIQENRWIRRMDRNQDGKMTLDEVPIRARPAPGSTGDPELVVKGGKLIMLRNGTLFFFDLTSLDLKSTVKVSDANEEAPRAPGGGGRDRGGRRGRDNRGGGGAPAGGGNADGQF